ncbi:MAG: S24/S26 family peptidase [Opitutaceae bacterium]|nr:S24/S26 family peptidase [Opitutaceae bacterium]
MAGLLAVFTVLSAPAVADDQDDPWIRGVFTGNSPRPIMTNEIDAWQRATRLAETTPDTFVLVGSGESMQPLYRPGTILVFRQLPYNRLERGQTALYRNRQSRVVAHVLVTKARDGWRVAGLNNGHHDMEPVQADNLVGVVIAAFEPKTPAVVRLVALAR